MVHGSQSGEEQSGQDRRRAMQAADIMVRDVISVTPDRTVSEVAKLLLDNRISGVPVIDRASRLVGIVSEGDLLRRVEAGTEPRRARWLDLLIPDAELANEYSRAHARRVEEIMTRSVITALESTPLRDLVDLMEAEHVKRIPIVRVGTVVGIVSRANLLQALRAGTPVVPPRGGDDRKIRDALLAELRSLSWTDSRQLNVIVSDGIVHLWGLVRSPEERKALRVAAENTAGVAGVEDHLVDVATLRRL
jgi:CBS domain-containing protein